MVLSQFLSPGPPHPLPSLLLSCLTALSTVSSPALLSPAQISLPALSLLSHSPSLSPQVRRALLSLQATVHPARPSLDIEDTNIATIGHVLAGKYVAEENDDGEEDLELSSTATQTEDTNTDNDHAQSGDDASKRIKELEDALKKAKAAEREARAEVIRKEKPG